MMRGWEFNQPVPERGYCWWYVDALSDDGKHGITIIAFIGTVFSPWYAWARRGGGGTLPTIAASMSRSMAAPAAGR